VCCRMAETQEPNPNEIPLVKEFLRIFQKVLGLLPNQEIEFMIELVPSTTPIFKVPYEMAPAELVELKDPATRATR